VLRTFAEGLALVTGGASGIGAALGWELARRGAVEVNLMGVVHGVQAAWPRMLEQGFGHVVNTASMAAFLPAAMLDALLRREHARIRVLLGR